MMVFIPLVGVSATTFGAVTDEHRVDYNTIQEQATTTAQNTSDETAQLEVRTLELQNVTAWNVSVDRL